ncbi:hypothetical protein FB451DRAFT_1558642 [Mycena latifolia]|nr:hypothetical protein FB451DRAFT_1572882 [Mycena latifolia]KAJ7473418.1 hypothetical protein FB451DRAFT_1558642 [Mycena latifolia]
MTEAVLAMHGLTAALVRERSLVAPPPGSASPASYARYGRRRALGRMIRQIPPSFLIHSPALSFDPALPRLPSLPAALCPFDLRARAGGPPRSTPLASHPHWTDSSVVPSTPVVAQAKCIIQFFAWLVWFPVLAIRPSTSPISTSARSSPPPPPLPLPLPLPPQIRLVPRARTSPPPSGCSRALASASSNSNTSPIAAPGVPAVPGAPRTRDEHRAAGVYPEHW